MGKITELPENLVRKIAAGEVITRPASAVKELIENSLDAGARRIEVRITAGGTSMIRVIDDGEGIRHEELELAFRSHTTSKISSEKDLDAISTLGFRGEALSSIAAVSRIEIVTKTREQDFGAKLRITGGKHSAAETAPSTDGTDVTLRDIFFNLPARKKFLKSARTEGAHVSDAVTRTALAYPGVAFKLIEDGEEVFSVEPAPDVLRRIKDVYSQLADEELVEAEVASAGITVRSCISKPETTRSNRSCQLFFVNGRPVHCKTFFHAVSAGYHTLVPQGRYPFCFLYAQIHPELVDVNVHPAKLEVRFKDEQIVYRQMLLSVKRALSQAGIAASGEVRFAPAGKAPADARPFAAREQMLPLVAEAPVSRLGKGEEDTQAVQGDFLTGLTQVHGSYIVAECEDGILIIDQHAAHERVMYEKIMSGLEKEGSHKQGLLYPVTIHLDKKRSVVVLENMEVLGKIGFDLEAFGKDTFVLRALPSVISSADPSVLIEQILDEIRNTGSSDMRTVAQKVASVAACHSAVRAGESLDRQQLRAIVDELRKAPSSLSCPHGRPAFIKLTLKDLEKRFHR